MIVDGCEGRVPFTLDVSLNWFVTPALANKRVNPMSKGYSQPAIKNRSAFPRCMAVLWKSEYSDAAPLNAIE